MAKDNKIILVCSQCLSRNYSTSKNHQQHSKRLSINKFCKHCNKHTLHQESK